MNEQDIINYAFNAMKLCLYISLPVLIVSTAVGLLVSLFQALTQLQDQNLAFSIKLIAVLLTLVATSNWYATELYKLYLAGLELFIIN